MEDPIQHTEPVHQQQEMQGKMQTEKLGKIEQL
jgi:hypothetical protein